MGARADGRGRGGVQRGVFRRFLRTPLGWRAGTARKMKWPGGFHFRFRVRFRFSFFIFVGIRFNFRLRFCLVFRSCFRLGVDFGFVVRFRCRIEGLLCLSVARFPVVVFKETPPFPLRHSRFFLPVRLLISCFYWKRQRRTAAVELTSVAYRKTDYRYDCRLIGTYDTI